MAKYTRELDALVKAISADIEEKVRGALLTHFGASGVPRTTARRGGTASKRPSRVKWRKRGPEDLAKLVDALEREIYRAPGRGIEAIGVAMGMETKELALPIKKLILSKAIRYTGEKRARKYFAADMKRLRAAKRARKSSSKRVMERTAKRASKRARGVVRVVASPLKMVEREELARAGLKTGT